jgi:hypothetical protein
LSVGLEEDAEGIQQRGQRISDSYVGNNFNLQSLCEMCFGSVEDVEDDENEGEMYSDIAQASERINHNEATDDENDGSGCAYRAVDGDDADPSAASALRDAIPSRNGPHSYKTVNNLLIRGKFIAMRNRLVQQHR